MTLAAVLVLGIVAALVAAAILSFDHPTEGDPHK